MWPTLWGVPSVSVCCFVTKLRSSASGCAFKSPPRSSPVPRTSTSRSSAAVDVGLRVVHADVGTANADGLRQRGVTDRARAVAVALALHGQRACFVDAAALLAAAVDIRREVVELGVTAPVEQSLSAAQPSPSVHGVEQVAPPQSVAISVPSLSPLTQGCT